MGESGIVAGWIQREVGSWYLVSITMLIKGVRVELEKLPSVS